MKLTEGGVTKDQYRMTIVDLNNLGSTDKPFIVAKDVAQVFYMKDMSSKPKKGINKQTDEPKWHIVLSGERNIIGVKDKADVSKDYNKFVEIPPSMVNVDPCILLANEDAPYLRRDHNQTTYVKSQ
jgi:ABC-type antimicrobial peptide transport system ATPase subunit